MTNETATQTTITLRGKTFAVEKTVEPRGHTAYLLTGKRGARYGTMRNLSDRAQIEGALYFVINLRGFGIAPGFEGLWLTDRNGTLEIARGG